MAPKIKDIDVSREFLIDFPVVIDDRGCLTPIEAGVSIPFDTICAKWIVGMNEKSVFTDRVLKDGAEIHIILSGTIDIIVYDNTSEKQYRMDKSNVGLYIPDSKRVRYEYLSNDVICLILTDGEHESCKYKEKYRFLQSNKYSVDDCLVVNLSSGSERGLSGYSDTRSVPFPIKRIFYIYNIPKGRVRGMHAHENCHEVLVAVNGNFSVELSDGVNNRAVVLKYQDQGLLLPSGIWAVEKKYTEKAICLAFASQLYESEGYISKYEDFVKYRQDEDRSI